MMKLGIEISMEVKKQKKLEYPFSSRPKNGELLNVKGGIHWLRMPLPIALNHINLWLLEGDEGFTIIDSGMSTDEAKDIWRNIFNGFIPPKKIEKILITHMHLDHSGLSGWLSSELNIAPHFTKKEYNETQKIIGGMTDDQIELTLEYYRKCGYDKKSEDQFRERIGLRKSLSSRNVDDIILIKDGETLKLSDGEWRVIIVEGHSPEHACLYNEDENVFICGDALLPRITPNVSVNPINPDANPLESWIKSLEKIKSSIPNDALVLPSHGYPYVGAHHRIDAIIENHFRKLDSVLDAITEPKCVPDLFSLLFKSEINEHTRVLAVGETMSHLNFLVSKGEIKKTVDENGLYSFAKT